MESDHSSVALVNAYPAIFKRTFSKEILYLSSGFSQSRRIPVQSNTLTKVQALSNTIGFSTVNVPNAVSFSPCFQVELKIKIDIQCSYTIAATATTIPNIIISNSLLQEYLMGLSSHTLARMCSSTQVQFDGLTVNTQCSDYLDLLIGHSRDMNYKSYVDCQTPKSLDFIYLYSNSMYLGNTIIAGNTTGIDSTSCPYSKHPMLSQIATHSKNPWCANEKQTYGLEPRQCDIIDLTYVNTVSNPIANVTANGLTTGPMFSTASNAGVPGVYTYQAGSISCTLRENVYNDLLCYNSKNQYIESNVRSFSVQLNLASNILDRVFKTYISRFACGVYNTTNTPTGNINTYELKVNAISTTDTPTLYYTSYNIPQLVGVKNTSNYYYLNKSAIVEMQSESLTVAPNASFTVNLPMQSYSVLPKNFVVGCYEYRADSRKFDKTDAPCAVLTALEIYVNNIISFNDLQPWMIHDLFCDNYIYNYKETVSRDCNFQDAIAGANQSFKISGSGATYIIPANLLNLDWSTSCVGLLGNYSVTGKFTFMLTYQTGQTNSSFGDRDLATVTNANFVANYSVGWPNAIGNKVFKVLFFSQQQTKIVFNNGNPIQTLECVTPMELQKARQQNNNVAIDSNSYVGNGFWDDLWSGVKDVGSKVGNFVADNASDIIPLAAKAVGLGKPKANKRLQLKYGNGIYNNDSDVDTNYDSDDDYSVTSRKIDILNSLF